MGQKVRYLYVEIRKTIGMLPRMLLQAILLMLLIGTAAFCGVRRMEREPLAVRADIGVVVREDNTMTRMALGYVRNLESASQLCRFMQVSGEEGLRLLERGELAALVVLPDRLVEGIMNGENPAVDIFFPKNAGLETMLLRELTESGAGLLRVAQAQIYGACDTALEYGLMERLSAMEAEIDSYNLAFALDRLAVYETETVSATGRLSVLQFYAASGAVLFLMLAGMAVYPVMQQEPQAFRRQLARQGTGSAWQSFCKWLCGFLCMGLLGVAAWAALRAAGLFMPETAERISKALTGVRGGVWVKAGLMLLVMITVSTYIYLIYSAAGSRNGSILLILLLSVAMVWLSGGFVPSACLPQTVQAVGEKLPTAYLIRAVGGMYAGYGSGGAGQCAAGMCAYTAAFGAAAYFLRVRE